jgi:hypothetical protein
MLNKLLQIIASGGVHTVPRLAQQLGVSEALLDSMLEELVRMGYLASASAGCSGQCDRCTMGGACAVGAPGRIWALTAAGERVAR